MVIAFFASVNHAIASTKNSGQIETEHLIKSGSVQLGGTLALPQDMKLNSLVIMISGSGPQDRDETLDGFKVFKALSEHLTKQGIANFRFDDRGVNASTGDFGSTTLDDHASDVRAIMAYFKANKTHRFSEFVLLGHSQGGIVSANVAVGNKDIKKVILMGAPSVPLVDIVLYQLRDEYSGTDVDKGLIEAEISAHNKLMHAIAEDTGIEEALEEFAATTKSVMSLTNANKTTDTQQIDALVEAKTKDFEFIYAMPSLTTFLYHDTAKDYEKLEIPVLSLFGGKDLQVTIDQNKDRMEMALLKSKTRYHFKTFNGANHYFQKAYTGKRDEYGNLDKKFVSGFLDSISNWLLEAATE